MDDAAAVGLHRGGAKPEPAATVELTAGGSGACLLADGHATCQMVDGADPDYGQMDYPQVLYRSMSVGKLVTCGIEEDGDGRCWGWTSHGQADLPRVKWRQLAMDYEHGCGIVEDGTVACWGTEYVGENQPPPGDDWIDVGTNAAASCALDSAGVPTCWGFEPNGLLEEPAGPFVDLVVESTAACGVSEAGQIECWASAKLLKYLPAPSETGLSHLTLGSYHACALREDGTALCWGDDTFGQLDVPGGTFRSVAAGDWFTCGARDDATVDCWGCMNEGPEFCNWGTPAPFFEWKDGP